MPGAPPADVNDSVLRERILAQKRIVGASRTPASFRDELELVLGLRAGTYRDERGTPYVSPPVEGADWDLWVLASSAGESARVAGELGLPLAANYHVAPSATLDTVAAYREAFRPGVLAEPYVVVSADVLVADTIERARELATPFADWVLSIRSGADGAIAYPEPGTSPAWEDRPESERALVADRVDTRIVGDPRRSCGGSRPCAARPAPTSCSSPPRPTTPTTRAARSRCSPSTGSRAPRPPATPRPPPPTSHPRSPPPADATTP